MKLGSFVLAFCLIASSSSIVYAEEGAAVYKAKCAMCHGPNGAGDTPMGKKLSIKALGSEDVQKLTDEQISQAIVKGKGKMPPFGKKVTDDQVKALVAHVRSLGKK